MSINVAKLTAALQQFVGSVANVQAAAVVSPDGLALASCLMPGMDEERVSAMAAALLSLSERIGRELNRGSIERVWVEGSQGYSIITNCTEEAVLLVLADRQAKLGVVNLEIKNVVSQLQEFLTASSNTLAMSS
ncbi:MAG: roadblock/LC7 domain-containing protein [Gloeomargarita sp. SKYBB_i_bin120]|nr:roadblock/LC7 domain-containing protein [Gloeomargarita sp. SKYG98]MCS7292820.1 roadblock/LC7 domain-containing protein [Gloeomargarita sp. SKYB120]MDW8178383.1 roadblock/LC7 domain-containing protein [Gloeomargarita sp. SKYBB_i_bin120]